jgi:hypothetical protein
MTLQWGYPYGPTVVVWEESAWEENLFEEAVSEVEDSLELVEAHVAACLIPRSRIQGCLIVFRVQSCLIPGFRARVLGSKIRVKG